MAFMDMSTEVIAIVSIAVIGSAIIKNGVGVGAGIFMLPFMALVLPPKIALGLGAPAMLISDIVGVKNYWGEWDKRELMILLPMAAIGTVFGCYLIDVTPDRIFKQAVGLFALIFSSIHIVKMMCAKRGGPAKDAGRTVPDKKWKYGLTVAFGFMGGVASTVAHAGGLMMSVYLLHNRAGSRMFVGTLVLFFAFINCIKLFAYFQIGIISSSTLVLVAALSPVIIIGGYIGNILNKRIPQERFRLIVLVLIFFIGLRLYLTA